MRATLAPESPGRTELIQVEEVARRFDVSVGDVLASCFVLGFAADSPTSRIDITAFTHAIKDAADREHARRRRQQLRRARLIGVAASMAVIAAALGATLATRGHTPARTPDATAAYRAEVESAYHATVGVLPTPSDYRALAQRWSQITPPAAMQAEHAKLISDANHVAVLAGNSPIDAPAVATLQTTTAVSALQSEVNSLGGRSSLTK